MAASSAGARASSSASSASGRPWPGGKPQRVYNRPGAPGRLANGRVAELAGLSLMGLGGRVQLGVGCGREQPGVEQQQWPAAEGGELVQGVEPGAGGRARPAAAGVEGARRPRGLVAGHRSTPTRPGPRRAPRQLLGPPLDVLMAAALTGPGDAEVGPLRLGLLAAGGCRRAHADLLHPPGLALCAAAWAAGRRPRL
jgi:hypothetical protein